MYWAVAEVNYYDGEGEWNRVQEPVGEFDTLEAAQEACAAREGDVIERDLLDDGTWQGSPVPDTGIVVFRIRQFLARKVGA